MSYKKIGIVLERLYKNTIQGNLKWEEALFPNTYDVSFSNYTARIQREELQGFEYRFKLLIINSEGKVIEEVDDDDLQPIISESKDSMKEIYETARRQALGVEQALDKILESLDDPDDHPF